MATATTDRLPRPPYLPLDDAFRVVEEIYAQGGGQGSYDFMSRIFSNSISSSSFVRKLAALKLYGLVTEAAKTVFLSETGTAIAAPTSPEVAADAKKEAFLRVSVFAMVFERHKGKLLPADEFLRNMIEQECNVPREASPSWVDAFKGAIRTVGLLYDRGDGKLQIMESAVLTRSTAAAAPVSAAPASSPVLPQGRFYGGGDPWPTQDAHASGHNSRIALSNNRFATFSIPDHLTPSDARKLKATLAGLASIIDSMAEETGDNQ